MSIQGHLSPAILLVFAQIVLNMYTVYIHDNDDDADQPASPLVILGVWQWPLTNYDDADQPASPLVTVY